MDSSEFPPSELNPPRMVRQESILGCDGRKRLHKLVANNDSRRVLLTALWTSKRYVCYGHELRDLLLPLHLLEGLFEKSFAISGVDRRSLLSRGVLEIQGFEATVTSRSPLGLSRACECVCESL